METLFAIIAVLSEPKINGEHFLCKRKEKGTNERIRKPCIE